MRNVIIFGEPRSGKSTLANMIADKFGYHIIHVDAIRGAFQKIYPELGIAPDKAMKNERFQLFLQEYLKKNTEEERNKYGHVLEGCETSVEDCDRLFNDGENIIYYLAPVAISSEEFFNNIRAYDTENDWSYDRSDVALMEDVGNMIKRGKELKEACLKHKIKFVDTSHDRQENLNKILEEIARQLEIA